MANRDLMRVLDDWMGSQVDSCVTRGDVLRQPRWTARGDYWPGGGAMQENLPDDDRQRPCALARTVAVERLSFHVLTNQVPCPGDSRRTKAARRQPQGGRVWAKTDR